MNKTSQQFLMVVGTSALALACAHQPPPNELAEARAIYARAAAGPAAKQAPARLRLAKQALADAEASYGAVPAFEVQDRAYIAIRKAEAAEAEASTQAARERRMAALRELATLTGVHADRARAELASAEKRASEAGQRADLAQAQVVAEQGRTLSAQQLAAQEQQRANDSEARLVQEKQARTEAEARAQQALDQLSRMAQVRQEARGVVITLSGQVLFVTDQATLLPAAQASLDNVATALKQVPAGAGRVTIEGHTDSTGQREYNMELARRRAEAVRGYLVQKGVPNDLLTVSGIGPDRPVANNHSPEGRANNRRVEIVIPSAALALEKVKPESPPAGGITPASATLPGNSPPRPVTTSPAVGPAPQPGSTSSTPPSARPPTTPGTVAPPPSSMPPTTVAPPASPNLPPSDVAPPTGNTAPGTAPRRVPAPSSEAAPTEIRPNRAGSTSTTSGAGAGSAP